MRLEFFLMKYIMLEDTNGRKIPIIFPDHLVHADMAKAVGSVLARSQKALTMPVGAGFINLGTDISVSGESETLSLQSREIDAAYIIAGEAGQYMAEPMMAGLMERIKARKPK
jgi:hypothetical protein